MAILPKVQPKAEIRTVEEVIESFKSKLSSSRSFQGAVLALKESWYMFSIHAGNNSWLVKEPWKLELDSLIQIFESETGATLCSGHASGLAKLYAHFGFESYPITYGLPNSPNEHTGDAATIVCSNSGELFLVSSMFNSALVDANGSLCDLRDYYRLLRQGKRDSVRFTVNTSLGKYLQNGRVGRTVCPLYEWTSDSYIQQGNENGTFLVKAPRTMQRYLSSNHFNRDFLRVHEAWEPYLLEAGYSVEYEGPKDEILLPLYIEGVYSNKDGRSDNYEKVWAIIQEMRGY